MKKKQILTKKTVERPKINRIKKATANSGASSRLISLWVNVDYTTVSSWNSNINQPIDDNINKIGELLEKDNRYLIAPQGRIITGLAKALEKELKRLHKEEKLPYEVEKLNDKNELVNVNNPELIKKLQNFAVEYKKTNGKISPVYFNKVFDELTKKELNGLEHFICNAKSSEDSSDFKFLVVAAVIVKEEGEKDSVTYKFVGCFALIEDAEKYIEQILENE